MVGKQWRRKRKEKGNVKWLRRLKRRESKGGVTKGREESQRVGKSYIGKIAVVQWKIGVGKKKKRIWESKELRMRGGALG